MTFYCILLTGFVIFLLGFVCPLSVHLFKRSVKLPIFVTVPQPRGRVVVAMYNYQAREDTDVSFTKGDRMEVLDDRLNVVLFFHRYITVASF